MFWFGRTDTLSTSSIELHLYNLAGTGTGSDGNVSAPNGSLYSEAFPVSLINPDGPNFHFLTNPISIWYDYAIGFDYSNLMPLDTIALLCSQNGEGDEEELALEKRANGEWYTLYESWSNENANYFSDVNLAFFSIVDRNAASIDSHETFRHSYANPMDDQLLISIDQSISDLKSVKIFDLNGELLLDHPVLESDRMELNTSILSAGTYVISFEHFNRSDSYAELIQKL